MNYQPENLPAWLQRELDPQRLAALQRQQVDGLQRRTADMAAYWRQRAAQPVGMAPQQAPGGTGIDPSLYPGAFGDDDDADDPNALRQLSRFADGGPVRPGAGNALAQLLYRYAPPRPVRW